MHRADLERRCWATRRFFAGFRAWQIWAGAAVLLSRPSWCPPRMRRASVGSQEHCRQLRLLASARLPPTAEAAEPLESRFETRATAAGTGTVATPLAPLLAQQLPEQRRRRSPSVAASVNHGRDG